MSNIIDPGIKNRLQNWKFKSAQRKEEFKNEPYDVKQLVNALVRLVGDSGCLTGDLAIVIMFALSAIGIDEEGEDE